MAKPDEPTMIRAIRLVGFIGELDYQSPQSLIVKYADKADCSLQRLDEKLDNGIRGKQYLKLSQSGSIIKEGSDLHIEIHKKHSRLRRFLGVKRTPEDGPLGKAYITFDKLWHHLASETQRESDSNLKVEFDNPIQGLKLWSVIEAYNCDLSALDARIKDTIEDLSSFRPILSRLSWVKDNSGMIMEFGKVVTGLNSAAQTVFACVEIVYKHFEAQEESHGAMRSLAESIRVLADQLNRLEEVPQSDQLHHTIREFPGMMEEVVDFIQKWLEHWTLKYILVAAQKAKVIQLRNNLDSFRERLVVDIAIEIRVKQATMADNVRSTQAGVVHLQEIAKSTQAAVTTLQENSKASTEQKVLDELVSALGRNRLSLRKPCMEGTRSAILQEIENCIKNIDGRNIIWIRGSPGVGKSALAASISNRLEEQGRHVISFRFDRAECTTITTAALWRVVASDLAQLYPSFGQQLIKGDTAHDSSNIDRLFNSLIETPLSFLDDVPLEELPVIVIDALDECGGSRYDSSAWEDYEGLLHTLKRWAQVDHLKKFKLVITSRLENRIALVFPVSISTHVDIPSGNGVGDNASDDIRLFLLSRLTAMDVDEAWISKALDYLVPRAAGIFICATTAADFLRMNPEIRFSKLDLKDNPEGLENLYSLYTTVITTSFGLGLSKEEIKAVTSIVGAMIFAKQPLDDDALIMLPGVKNRDMLRFVRRAFVSVIDTGSILHFYHLSFEDFLLSSSFRKDLPMLSAIQDRGLHEHRLAVLCLKTMASPALHFNMCNLESSSIMNEDIPTSVKSAISPLLSYSSRFWIDHVVHTECQKLVEAVRFLMYEKLLFWMEAMSLLGKAYEAPVALEKALAWPVMKTLDPDNELTSFISDTLRFISAFIIPISKSAPHIYLSVLPFLPENSLIATKFRSKFPNTVAIAEGKLTQWSMTIFNAEYHNDPVNCIVFSADERTFASLSANYKFEPISVTVCICDSETGHSSPGPIEFKISSLSRWPTIDACFSPDGKHILVKWDGATFMSYAIVWNIERSKEQFRLKGLEFAFIRHGRHGGKLVSTEWAGFLHAVDPPSTILVKLWDTDHGAPKSTNIFEIPNVAPRVRRFSPDGQFLAVGKDTEDIIELWKVEDGKSPRRFPRPPGKFSSIQFTPTSDFLMAGFKGERCIVCVWKLDTQEMASFDLDIGRIPAVVRSHLTNHIFIPKMNTVEVWEVSMTSSNMIFEKEPPIPRPTSICPSHDGRRVLVGSSDGGVKMWSLNLEDLTRNQPGVVDTRDDADIPRVIALSHSGTMAAVKSPRSDNVEFRDTTTGAVIGRKDIAMYDYATGIAFSPDGDQIAFSSESLVTICNVMHPENCFSFDPWNGGTTLQSRIAFQTHDHLVICTDLDVPDDAALLQVWSLKNPTGDSGFECTFSLCIKMTRYSDILLAPDGLTVIISNSSTISCYSWHHDTAKFHPFHFTDAEHLVGLFQVYSPDGKLFACCSSKDGGIRVWDTQTGGLYGKPINVPAVSGIAVSPTVNHESLGDRLIAVSCYETHITSVFDVHTGHPYTQFWNQRKPLFRHMAFLGDGTKLASYLLSGDDPIRVWDIVDLTAKKWHATRGYELMLQGIKDGWMMGRNNEPLFWVPSEHREYLCVPLPKVVIGVPRNKPTYLDLSMSRLCSKWTECIDKGWLKELEGKETGIGELLEDDEISCGCANRS